MKLSPWFRLCAAVTLPLLLANCAVSTPASRAERKPAEFQALPAAHQKLALAGEIKEGMTRHAVWVAWGPASRIVDLSDGGVKYELWRYTEMQPIYRHSIGMGFGGGFYHPGCRGRGRGYHHHPYYDMNFGPDYVPYTAAEVKFRHGLVKSWQRVSPRL